MVIVGTIFDIKKILVHVDGSIYKISSVLEAIDVLFKIFFTLNLPYPIASKTTYVFMQEYFYNIKCNEINADSKKANKKYSCVINTINYLK